MVATQQEHAGAIPANLPGAKRVCMYVFYGLIRALGPCSPPLTMRWHSWMVLALFKLEHAQSPLQQPTHSGCNKGEPLFSNTAPGSDTRPHPHSTLYRSLRALTLLWRAVARLARGSLLGVASGRESGGNTGPCCCCRQTLYFTWGS
jgi:hypothetical protein